MAGRAYWRLSSDVCDLYHMAEHIDADVWLANDWMTLPIAQRLAEENGGIYGYDSHELATEEFAHRLRWRLLKQPLAAVSEEIAGRLRSLYSLPSAPVVIRNTPFFENIPFRPTTAPVRVIYQGIIAPGRGLEAVSDSVSAWRAEFDLTLRGPGDAAFLRALQRRIAESGQERRVRLAPAVPMTALVREAADFDVGLFALPGSSLHNEFALPNKLFEYTMAGLAACVTELPEMARVVRQHDIGVTIPKVDPGAIADTINSLTTGDIDRYKRNALAAAPELCWERESERLLAPYDALFDRRSSNLR